MRFSQRLYYSPLFAGKTKPVTSSLQFFAQQSKHGLNNLI